LDWFIWSEKDPEKSQGRESCRGCSCSLTLKMSHNLPLRHLTCENKITHNLLQIRVVTSTAIQILSTGAKAFSELNSAAIHFVSSCWIQTKCIANESHKKSFWMHYRTSSSNRNVRDMIDQLPLPITLRVLLLFTPNVVQMKIRKTSFQMRYWASSSNKSTRAKSQ
jgi:phosphatidylserine/phosphatidylglycerophosphate/cardiolipin synthase-like enzyme